MGNTPNIRFKGFTDDWEQRKLSDIVDVLDGDRGKNYPKETDFDTNGHTLFLNASNVTTDGFSFDTNQFISEEKSDSMGNGKLIDDDIVITSRGSLGHIAWYSADIQRIVPYVRINSGMLILRKKVSINTSYLYQFMKSDKGQNQISFMSFGSAQPQLTKKGIEGLNVNYPKKSKEQAKIGEYFSNLDNLITLHQRKCDETKELKKFMLQKMFPKNGEKKPEIRFEGFTDDWEQRKLGATNTFFTDGNYGEAYPKSSDMTDSGSGIPFLTGGNLKDGKLSLDGASYITPEKHSKLTSGHLLEDDIVIAVRGSLGALGYVNTDNSGWNINSQLAILRTDKSELYGKFLIQYLLSWTGQNELLKRQTGSALKQLPIGAIKDVEVPITSIAEQGKIGEYFSNLDNLITLHQRKCDEIKEIKKFMLQNMFPQKG